MLNIETTPRTVENTRSTSLAMRKLPLMSSPDYDDMLITFCFGLLTINFAPLWNDACAALKAVADRSGAKVWEMAFSQLSSEKDDISEHETQSATAASKSSQDDIWSLGQLDLPAQLQRLYEMVISNLKRANEIDHFKKLR
jgi:hypothetical protein